MLLVGQLIFAVGDQHLRDLCRLVEDLTRKARMITSSTIAARQL